MISNEQRMNRLRQLPEGLQDFYGSLGLAQKLAATEKMFQVSNQSNFVDAVGDTILGFYHTKDLPTLLQREVGVSADVSQKIMADLIEILTPVLDREREAANAQVTELRQLKEQFGGGQIGTPVPPSVTNTSTPTPSNELPVTEGVNNPSVHDVVPMRTMATDMHRVHGYGAYREQNPSLSSDETPTITSNQDEVLNKRPRLAGVPQVGE